jgi:hypothetical protein
MAEPSTTNEINQNPSAFSADKQKNAWQNRDQKQATETTPLSLTQQYEKATGIPPKQWLSLLRETPQGFAGEELKSRQLDIIRKKTRENLEKHAIDKANAPYVQIDGIGFVEVPAAIVAQLSNVDLGFPIGLSSALESFQYLEKTYGLDRTEWMKVKWAGTAQEAVDIIRANEAKQGKQAVTQGEEQGPTVKVIDKKDTAANDIPANQVEQDASVKPTDKKDTDVKDTVGNQETEKEAVEKLQKQITSELAELHRLSLSFSGQDIKQHQVILDELNQKGQTIDSLYRKLPSGYHAVVELTPEGFYSNGGEKQWWLKKDTKGGALRHFARVGQFTNPQDVSPGKTVLNMGLISHPDEVPKFSFNEVSKDKVTKGNTVNPKDILNIRIEQNPTASS